MTGQFITDPYKGYVGKAEYQSGDKLIHGRLLGIVDLITFAARRPQELQRAFEESVDDYLKWCAKRGKEPHRPASGKMLLRTSPELHRKLATLAAVKGESVNSLVVSLLETAVEHAKV